MRNWRRRWLRWGPAVVAGGFCVAFLVMIWAIADHSFRPPLNHPAVNGAYSNTQAKPETEQPQEPVWWRVASRTTVDPVALWTFILVIFTGILSVVSIRQFKYLRRADHTARIAATAARQAAAAADLSAKAAIGVELPSLHIAAVTTSMDFPSGPEEIKTWVKQIIPVISIVNYGRTPAFVTEVTVNVDISKALPKVPVYKMTREFHDRFVISGGKPHTYTEYWYYNNNVITEDEITSFVTEDCWLHIYGVINFMDFLDARHKRGFSFFWGRTTKNFLTLYEPEYNYQT